MSTYEQRQARLAQRMVELDKNPNPWYKEPWPWILLSGPAVAVVACIITIYLAFSTGGNEPMGGAKKRGLVVEVETVEAVKESISQPSGLPESSTSIAD